MNRQYSGTVREWDRIRSFGFIQPDAGSGIRGDSVFVHSNEFGRARLGPPTIGARYRFNLKIGRTNEIQACDLAILSNSDAPAVDGGGACPAAAFDQGAAADKSGRPINGRCA